MPQTPAGEVRGVRTGGVTAFRGIPYADSTARFQPPGPVRPWSGVRDATEFGPPAPQVGAPGAEDGCLTLNIWTPAVDGRLPVLVWLHGGRYQEGSGADPWTDGTRLAATGEVVVVTVNYRLGAFGFLHLGDRLGADFATSGTVGLQDQIAALRWVRDAIAGFGGDPGTVTVFGESAGGAAVVALLTMPGAAGLFHRAIAQSPPTQRVLDRAAADRVTGRMLELSGVTEPADLLTLPAGAVLDAQRRLLTEHLGPSSGQPFQPVVDGVSLPLAPLAAARLGRYADVPVLLGTNREEAGSMVSAPWFPRTAVQLAELIADAPGDYRDAVSYLTDTEYLLPTIRFAEALAGTGARVWCYLFAWAPDHDGNCGACHSIEIPFVFDNLDRPGVAELCGPRPPRKLARRMGRAWRTFARAGVPPDWPPYRRVMVFGGTDVVAGDPHRDLRTRWNLPDISPRPQPIRDAEGAETGLERER
jgi:para-nitrobenzyl esterase